MTPQEAFKILTQRGWLATQIADYAGVHRSAITRIRKYGGQPGLKLGLAVIELAKSRRKPPKRVRKTSDA
jgi:hypothetical protein